MRSISSAVLFRSKAWLSSPRLREVVRRNRYAARMMERVKHAAESMLSRRRLWLQVRSGPAAGTWMHLELPREAGYWAAVHERDLQQIIATTLKPGQVAYDIGAHVGFITAAMAQALGPTGRVIAFEPDSRSVVRLREHVDRNRWNDRVEVVQRAVWQESCCTIGFRRGGPLASRGGIEHSDVWPVLASGEIVHVAAVSIDDFVRNRACKPDFIKIDVEGAEAEVLRGAFHTVRRYRPILAVEVHHAEALAKIERWLADVSYDAKWLVPEQSFPRQLLATPARD